jgi:hypothetical protein
MNRILLHQYGPVLDMKVALYSIDPLAEHPAPGRTRELGCNPVYRAGTRSRVLKRHNMSAMTVTMVLLVQIPLMRGSLHPAT